VLGIDSVVAHYGGRRARGNALWRAEITNRSIALNRGEEDTSG
jgi:hypothetical protein